MRARIVFWLAILLAALLLYLTLRGVDWSAFLRALRGANYLYIGLLFLWSSASYLIRATRWRVLLNSQKQIKTILVFWANMAGYLGNTVLPARAGELVRAGYISRREGIPIVFVLATGLTERLIDLAALVIIGVTSLFFTEAFPDSVHAALEKFGVIAVLGVICIFLLPLFHGLIQRMLTGLPWLSQGWKGRVLQIIEQFVDGLKTIGRIERGIPFLLFTALIWLMDGIGTIVLAEALHESLSLAQSFLLIAALGISSALPSTPGYLGVYQFVAVTVLVPFGFTREAALAFITLLQASNLLLVFVWGGMSLWREAGKIIASDQQLS